MTGKHEVPDDEQEEYCAYCESHCPAHGYWRCPVCDAEWPDDDEPLPPEQSA